jgi:hypothetical protein
MPATQVFPVQIQQVKQSLHVFGCDGTQFDTLVDLYAKHWLGQRVNGIIEQEHSKVKSCAAPVNAIQGGEVEQTF